MKLDAKSAATLIGGILVLLGGASGVLYISTPEAQECEVELGKEQVRNELQGEALEQCKTALQTCATAMSSEGSP